MITSDRVRKLRSQCEPYFYEFAIFLTKEDAEIAAVTALKLSLQNELKLHEILMDLCDSSITAVSKHIYDISKKYVLGAVDANIARKKSHETYITNIKADLAIINLKMI